jgi:excinuclease ABC subunit B
MEKNGYVNGIENYSRHLAFRNAGEPPATLLDYFPKPFLLFIDESHIAVPQLRGMYSGDRQRKVALVTHGWRLPSALDNRPLRFDEFAERIGQTVFVSATPGDYEMDLTKPEKRVAEQIVRPTGILDPEIRIRPATSQIEDLLKEIHVRVRNNERVLALTLTKRQSEDLTEFLLARGIRAHYLHSEIKTLDRPQILSAFRRGEYDVLVGINLLREGLDLPEVGLVAILDADREGFLRNYRSIIQIAGRAARSLNGTVVLYADSITNAISRAVNETRRRRVIQTEFNTRHGIEPRSIVKAIADDIFFVAPKRAENVPEVPEEENLTQALEEAIENWEFERAEEIARKMKAATR